MNGSELEQKSEIKDLGIIVDENLRPSNHIKDKATVWNSLSSINFLEFT